MYKVKQLANSLAFVLFLVLIFFLMVYSQDISQTYNLSPWVINVFSFISILYIGYRYMSLELRTGKLEHEFRSIMNHTFRTPLTRVMWFTKELEKDMPQKDRMLFLQNINNATTRVLDIIDLLVGIKKVNDVSSYDFQATSLREVVEKSINKYREEITSKNLVFQISTFVNIPLLSVDLKKISFVIDAVIENAILYTPSRGIITIECITGKRMLTLYVSDTGLGLTFRDKMRIFSRFYRSAEAKKLNTDGMGIRLYLSKQIIARHHGDIYAKSKGRNRGTTFFVELPFINS
jgi:two-component system sensor histidine kinase VicK